MINKLKLISVLLLAVLFTACSYEYRLEVVNHTSEPLNITYKIKEENRFTTPEIVSIEGWQKHEEAKPLSANDYQKNTETGEVILKIQPKQVVILDRGSLNPEAEDGMMNINEISLDGKNGKTNYSGNKFYKNFEEKNSGFYTIEYK